MADQHLTGAEGVPGQRVGGSVIHFPAVVWTSSPSISKRVKARLRERVRYSRPLRVVEQVVEHLSRKVRYSRPLQVVEQVVEHLCGAVIRVVDHLSAAGPTG